MQIGLEIGDAQITAITLGDDGRVVARASGEAGADLGQALRASIRTLGGGDHRSTIGIAAVTPEAPAVSSAVALIANDGPNAMPVLAATGGAAAVAEAWVGAARGKGDVVFFAVADHAIGGVLRGGSLIVGARSRAASVAWLALNPVEREDYRKIGCLEAEVAAAGIVRRLIWRIKAGDRSHVQDIVGENLSAITVEHVLGAARSGDGVAISVVRDTAKYLGMAAANLVAIADPEVLVLGGIMASAADLLLEPIRVEVTRRLPRPMMDALTIAPAALGADGPAIGAARLAAIASR